MSNLIRSTSTSNPTESNAYMIYVPVAVFFVICPLAVGARFWSRMRKGGKVGIDDMTILASLAFAIASSGVMIASCYYGYGKHMATLEHDDMTEAMKYFYICQITYKSSINLTKSSILFLYLRLFTGSRWFKWSCVFVLTCVAMYWVGSVTATIFQCDPINKAFDQSIPGQCIDNGKFWYANAGFSIATDFIIWLLPIKMIHGLQLPRAQKAALIFVFTLGIFVVITSCLRVTTIDIQATTTDKTYDISSTMWTIIEMNVAIVCACLPQIRPLIVKIFPKIMRGSSASRDKQEKPMLLSDSVSSRPQTQPRGCEDGSAMEAATRQMIHMGQKNGGKESQYDAAEEKHDGGIRKTVHCSVEFSKELPPFRF